MTNVERFVGQVFSGAERSQDVERYLALFEMAVAREPPPYFQAAYGESFRANVGQPVWVIQSLISNAVKEGEGSRDLAVVADECEDAGLASDLEVHIGDEARHCRMYVRLIDLVFPDALPAGLREHLRATFPPVAYRAAPARKRGMWKMLDYLIQINLGEVRTRLHQKLLEPVLDCYCPAQNQEKLCGTLCKLAGDECCHIKYTASRIGALSREFPAADVERLFHQRFQEFNQYTLVQLGTRAQGLPAAPLVRDA